MLTVTALGGCITQGSEPLTAGQAAPLDLAADGAQVLRTADGVSLLWKGNAGFAVANPSPVGLPLGLPLPVGAGSLNDAQLFHFELPRQVTKVEATLRWSHADIDLNLAVRNGTSRTQCRSNGLPDPTAEHCFTWLVGQRADTETWSALVGVADNVQGMASPEPFALTLNLTTLPWQWLGPALGPAQQSTQLAFRTLRVDESRKTGEPSLKVDDQGAVYIAAPTGPLQSLWISRDQGKSFTWTDISNGATPPRVQGVQGGGGDSDVAVSPDGKDVYFGDLWSCMAVASSHDSAQTWFNQPLACDAPGVDRQWLATTGPDHVWLVYNGRLGMTLEHSFDGGMTWPTQTHIAEDNCARGNIVVTADGKDLYAAGCNDQGIHLVHSADMGTTYDIRPVVKGDRTAGKDWSFCNACSIFQVVALDKAGNLYVVWSDPTGGEQDVY
ncbi:MAG: glycoside hydrolase, partial [Halobacteriales archaeon]|nr:glycoside hydrolase [Halobacteriales archaeon]